MQNKTWKNYCTCAATTAKYPELGTASSIEVAYLALGLIGELGELGSSVKKFYEEISEEALENFYAELGDCMWYIAMLSNVSEFWIGRNIEPTLHESPNIQRGYADSMGAIANSSKKIIRDSCDPDKFIGHVKVAADDLAALFAANAGATVSTYWEELNRLVLEPNLLKLRSRLERNVISGDGDKR